jgi:hypothetical protein
MNSVRPLLVVLVVAIALGVAGETQSAPPVGWDSTIILRGQERSAVKSMPIDKRPMRPLHIYGNTIRRVEHRVQR